MPDGRAGYRGHVSGKPPPLSMRLRLRHWVAVDCLIAAGCGLIMLVALHQPPGGPRSLPGALAGVSWPLPLLTAAGLTVPVAIRRLWPLPALAAVLTASAVVMATGHLLTRGPVLPLLLVLYLVAAGCRRPVALAGLAATLAVLAAQGLILHLAGSGSGDVAGHRPGRLPDRPGGADQRREALRRRRLHCHRQLPGG